MTPKTKEIVRRIKKRIERQRSVLDIGSLDINGSVKDIFEDAERYVGVDIVSGSNVDMVMNAHKLKFDKESFDCVLALGLFEHDNAWWKSLEEIKRVLKHKGWFILQVPTIVDSHNPPDYWRFTKQGVKEIMKDFKNVKIIKYYRNIYDFKYLRFVRYVAYGQKP